MSFPEFNPVHRGMEARITISPLKKSLDLENEEYDKNSVINRYLMFCTMAAYAQPPAVHNFTGRSSLIRYQKSGRQDRS